MIYSKVISVIPSRNIYVSDLTTFLHIIDTSTSYIGNPNLSVKLFIFISFFKLFESAVMLETSPLLRQPPIAEVQ